MIKGFLLLQALPQGPLHSKEHNKSPDSILRERGWLDTEGTKALYRPPRDPPPWPTTSTRMLDIVGGVNLEVRGQFGSSGVKPS